MQHRPKLRAQFQAFTVRPGQVVRINFAGVGGQLYLYSGEGVTIDGSAFVIADKDRGTHPLRVEFPVVFDAYGLPWQYDQVLAIGCDGGENLSAMSGILITYQLAFAKQPGSDYVGRRPIDNSPTHG